jgi:hypothetical protein
VRLTRQRAQDGALPQAPSPDTGLVCSYRLGTPRGLARIVGKVNYRGLRLPVRQSGQVAKLRREGIP